MARGVCVPLLSLSLLLVGCPAETRRPDTGPTPRDAGPAVDATVDAGPSDAGPVDAGPPDAGPLDSGPVDAGPLDAGPPDAGPIDAGPCGDYGGACCPGDSCGQGACLAGRCAAFGGIYALQGESSDECVGNPLNGGACACPAGFVQEALEDVDGDTDEGTGWETRIFHCRAPADVPGADYRGGFGALLGEPPTGCTPSCSAPNQLGGDCGCPSGGTVERLMGVHYVRSSVGPDCRREVGLCRDPSADPYTYGGFFWEMTDSGLVCEEFELEDRCRPNPVTGDCSCPTGFTGTRMNMMQIHADAARAASNWFCRGRLTVCQRLPD